MNQLQAQLVKEIIEVIKKNPGRHEQSSWFGLDDEGEWSEIYCDNDMPNVSNPDTDNYSNLTIADGFHKEIPEWDCGSTCCAAGFACILRGWLPIAIDIVYNSEKQEIVEVIDKARELMGLNYTQAEYLFMHTSNITVLKLLEASIEEGCWDPIDRSSGSYGYGAED